MKYNCTQSRMTKIGEISYTNGKGNGTPLQYSCLENPMDGGAWWAEEPGGLQSMGVLSQT